MPIGSYYMKFGQLKNDYLKFSDFNEKQSLIIEYRGDP